jgi:hypothetical protein
MNPIDEPHDPDAPMPELLEDYKSHQAKLLAHSRELQRLRDQVRSTAEREAAAIVTNARRDVRKVLLDARHELLVLVAQLQAVGCETQSTDRAGDLPGEATPANVDPFAPTREIVSGARRDMREVLIEARAELLALADEGRDLRAHVAEQRTTSPPEINATPTVDFMQAFDVEPLPVRSAVDKPSSAPPTPTPIAAVRGRAAAGAPSMHYTAPAASRPMWLAGAAAVVLAAVVVGLLWWPGVLRQSNAASRTPATAAQPAQQQRPSSPSPAARSASAAPASAAAAPTPRAVTDPSIVHVTIEAKRPSWIRTTADGSADLGRLYAAGETRTVTARQDLVLRVGDAGAVLVSVDGQPAKVLGIDGQVITRRFTPRQPRAVAVNANAAPKPERVQQAVATPAPAPAREPAAAPAAREPAPAPRADVGTGGTTEIAAMAPRRFTPPQIAPPAAVTPSAPQRPAPSAELEIVNANSRWFEAYYAGDRTTMQSFSSGDFTLADERTGNRLTAAAGVQRSMDQIRVEVAGDGAVLSARLIERATVGGEPVQQISMVSQVWIRQNGRWRLVNVRFIDAANLGRGLR